MKPVSKTRKIEKSVVSAVVKSALELGYTISVWDGGDWAIKSSSGYKAVMEACFSTDEDILVFRNGGVKVGSISLVYGNSGYDVISDYSMWLEPMLKNANNVANRLEMAWVNFNVGDLVVWSSAVGPVEVEYRGSQWGMDGREACVIVREEGSPPYQTIVPFNKLTAKEK